MKKITQISRGLKRSISFLTLIFLFSTSISAQFSTAGSGLYLDEIYWLDFSSMIPDNDISGETFGPTVFNVPGGIVLSVTVQEISSGVQSQVAGAPRAITPLYTSVLERTLRNRNVGSDATIKVIVSATLNGNPYPIGLVMADGEASGTGEDFVLTINSNTGTNWTKIEEINPTLFSDSGVGTQVYSFFGAGSLPGPTGYGTPIMYTEQVALANPLDINAELIRTAGGTGVAIGVFVHTDYGDAPGYAEAIHTFSGQFTPTTNLFLGTAMPDSDGVIANRTNASATADSDEGVPVFDLLTTNTSSYSVDVTVNNNEGVPANLAGWIDFDNNGTFDIDEYATASVANGTTNGVVTLTWNNINSSGPNSVESATFARFRLSTETLTASDASGNVSNGEVEDYQLNVVLRDNDGDGIDDDTDLDDDNDGITDINEGLNCASGVINVGTAPAGNQNAVGAINDIYDFDGVNVDVTAVANVINGGSLSQLLVENTTSLRVQGQQIDESIGETVTYTFTFNQAVSDVKFRWSGIDQGDRVTINASGPNVESVYMSNLMSPSSFPNTDYLATSNGNSHVIENNNSLSPTITAYSDGVLDTTLNYTEVTISGQVTSFNVVTSKQRQDGDVTNNGNVTFLFSNLEYCSLDDTDDDDIPNYLDLDSDNDSCFDALEGNGGVLSTQVDSSGEITGGVNTGTGIPNTAGSGQSDVSSIDNTTTGAQCDDDNDGVVNVSDVCPNFDDSVDTDGDLVPDGCDLDNDNDGISDITEGCNSLTLNIDGVEDSSFPTGFWAASYYEGHQAVAASSFTVERDGSGNAGSRVFRGESFFGVNSNAATYSSGGSSINDRWSQFETPTIPLRPDNYTGTTWASSGNPYYEIDFRRTFPNAGTLSFGSGATEIVDDVIEVFVDGVRAYAYFPSGGAPDPRPGGGVTASIPVTAGAEVEIRFMNLGFIGGLTFTFNSPAEPLVEVFRDSDGDTIPDCLELDSDDDGCSDADEGYNDTDADGTDGGQYGDGTPANINPANGLVDAPGVDYGLALNAGVTDDTINICTVLSGQIFIDVNGNGIFEGAEPKARNVDVRVTDALNNIQVVTTNFNGIWTATSLAPGIATVDIIDPDYGTTFTQTVGTDPSNHSVTVNVSNDGGIDGFVLPPPNVLHTTPACDGTLYSLNWDTVPEVTADNEFDWTPDGAFTNTFNDVNSSGINITHTFTGEIGTLSAWPGSTLSPNIGFNATVNTQEVLQIHTDGLASSSAGIIQTITFSDGSGATNIYSIGFDLFDIDFSSLESSGDRVTITAIDGLGNTIFPTFTTGATPNFTVDGATGVVNANNGTNNVEDSQLGVNFLDADGITSISIVWNNCAGCAPLESRGIGFGNSRFCTEFPPTLSVSSPTVTEGTNLDFAISLSNASTNAIEFTPALAGTGVNPATIGTDTGTPLQVQIGSGAFVDYTGGSITIPAGETSVTFRVPTTNDTIDESDETLNLNITGITNSSNTTASGLGTIEDNDNAPTLSVSSPTVTEGTNLDFAISLSNASSSAIEFTPALAGTGVNPATIGTDTGTPLQVQIGSGAFVDYTGGSITIPAGETSVTFRVPTTNDTIDESDETLNLNLTGITNSSNTTASGLGTIEDNDGAPTLSVSSPTVTEGTNLDFALSLSNASSSAIEFTPALAGTGVNPATIGTDTGTPLQVQIGSGAFVDYTGGSITIPAGETSVTFRVPTTNDTIDESDETLNLNLTGITNSSNTTASGLGTIEDNDGAPTLSVSSPTVTEGTNLDFAISLSNASSSAIEFTPALAGTGVNPATIGTDTGTPLQVQIGSGAFVDYTGGSITIPAGETSVTFRVPTTNDTIDESDETLNLNITGITNSSNTTASGLGTIEDNDGAPTLSVSSPTVTEGTNLDFAISLSNASSNAIEFTPALAGTGVNPATIGTDTGTPLQVQIGSGAFVDYTGGSITIPAGETSVTFRVPTTNDTIDESDETLNLNLTGITNSSNTTASGLGTIEDNDGAPTLSVSSPTVTEGTNLDFAISLSNASSSAIEFTPALAGTGVNPATIGTDTGTPLQVQIGSGAFVDYTGGSITIPAGETSVTFRVPTTNDTIDESDETLNLNITGITNSSNTTASGLGTIEDNDGAPTLSVSSPTVTEGTNLDFAISLSNASSSAIEFTPALAGTGVNPATIGTDTGTPLQVQIGSGAFVDYTGGSITIPAGETSVTFRVPTTNDTIDESDETLNLNITGITNSSNTTASGLGTIEDNDGAPTLSVSSPTVTEGTNLDFAISLSNASSSAIEFTPALAGTGVNPANIGTDTGTPLQVQIGSGAFVDYTGGSITIPAGETSVTFRVPTTNDTIDESDETLNLNLTGITNSSNTTASGLGTIEDNDGAPTLSVSSPTVTEGTNLDFAISLSNASSSAIEFTPALAGTGVNPATIGTDTGTPLQVQIGSGAFVDYTGGSITIPAGETSVTFRVPTTNDTIDESDETLNLNITGITNSSNTTASGLGTIKDNDGAPTLSVSSPTVTEGTNLDFAISLSNASSNAIEFTPALAGTGVNPATIGTDTGTPLQVQIGSGAFVDYTGGSITIPAGETSVTFRVPTTNDTIDESDETLNLNLTGITNSSNTTASGLGTIEDNDGAPTLSVSSPTVTEGTNLDFALSLSNASSSAIEFTPALAGTGVNPATIGTDTGTPLQVQIGSGAFVDYTGGSITIPAGETSVTFRVPTTNDTIDESDETLNLNLTGITNSSNTTASGLGTIEDNDGAPTLSVSSPTVTEGTNLDFAISLSNASSSAIEFTPALAGTGVNPATIGTDTGTPLQVQIGSGAFVDYTGGSITIPAGETSVTFRVPTTNDTIDESDETLNLNITGITNSSNTTASGLGTIEDNDLAPTLSVSSPTVTEGTNLDFAISLSNASSSAIEFTPALAGTGVNPATIGTDTGTPLQVQIGSGAFVDYTGGSITIPAGETSVTFRVPTTNDTIDESDETLNLNLTGITNSSNTTASGLGTIEDNDGAPTLSVSSPTVTEGTNLDFAISLSNASSSAIEFTPALAGTGVNPATISTDTGTPLQVQIGSGAFVDYTGGSITIPAGETSVTFRVPTTNDTIDESDETLNLNLTGITNSSNTTASGLGTIEDNDGAPTLSVSSPTVTEGTNLDFAISLSNASSSAIEFTPALAGTGVNPATIGTDTGTPLQVQIGSGAFVDYTGGSITIPAGETSVTFRVPTTNDTIDESDETLNLNITGITNSSNTTASGLGTIEDNDVAPTLSVSSPTVTEGTNLDFAISLSNASSSAIEFTPALAGTGVNPATIGTDTGTPLQVQIGSGAFVDYTGGSITIPAGETSVTFRVPTTNDTIDESDETLNLNLTGITNSSNTTASGLGTIEDNDGAPTLSVSSPTVTEGTNLDFAISLSNASSSAIEFTPALAGTGVNPATIGTDTGTPLQVQIGSGAFVDYTGGSITIPAGETSVTFRVPTTNDTIDESDETLNLNLTGITNSSNTTASGLGTIEDNDVAPTLSVSSPTVTEGTNLDFAISLSNASSSAIEFTPALAGTGVNPATIGTDTGTPLQVQIGSGAFVDYTGGSITIPAGETSVTFRVPTTNDTIDESDETLNLNLTGITNSSNTTASGLGTIEDNDGAPTLSVSSPTVTEGTNLDFAISLSNASSSAIEFTPALAGTGVNPATIGTDTGTPLQVQIGSGAFVDYTGGSITIPAGETSVTFRVPTTNDTIDESDETLNLNLTGITNSSNTTASGLGTIEDNDVAPTLSVSSPTVTEGTNLDFAISLSNASSSAIEFTPALAGTGVNPATIGTDTGTPLQVQIGSGAFVDYTGGSITIPAGETSVTFRVPTTNDTIDESDETLNLNLTGITNSSNTTASGLGTIEDNDGAPTLSVSSPTVTEGTNLDFAISLSNASSSAIEFTPALAGTGVNPATIGTDTGTPLQVQIGSGAFVDYTGGSITIPAGETSVTFRVPTTNDTIDESDETLNLNLTGITNSSNTTASGLGTIEDNDLAPTLSVSSPTVTEGTNLDFAISLSNASSSAIEFTPALAGTGVNPATIGTDTGTPLQVQIGSGAFVDYTGGSITIPAGETSVTFRVPTTNDTIDESDETLNLNLTGITNSSNTTASGLGTIEDNDLAPTVSTVSSPIEEEGDALSHTVSLSNGSSSAISIAASVANGTAGNGDYDTDLANATYSDGVTYDAVDDEFDIPAGVTSFTVAIASTEDTIDEPNENYTLTVGGVNGTGTITDDDDAPDVTIGDASATEGGDISFPVTLSNPSSEDVILTFSFTNGTAENGDYTTTDVQVTILAGDTMGTVVVPTTADTIDEGDETFTVAISSVDSGTVGDTTDTATGTITDDDDAPDVTIGDASATEGGDISFPVTLSNPSSEDVILTFSFTNGTAENGDYTTTDVQVTILAGDTMGTVVVPTTADTIDEGDETFTVAISSVDSGTVGDTTDTATGTITDDDDAPDVTIGDASATEGGDISFPVTLSNPSSEDVILTFSFTNGTAENGDYTTTDVQVTILAGDTMGTVVVPTTADTIDEGDETFTVAISSVDSGTVGDTTDTATGTITDDDDAPDVTIGDASATEGGDISFPVTLSNPSSEDVILTFSFTNGTAENGDYTTTDVQVTILAGDTTGTVVVPTTADTIDEGDETFTVAISSVDSGTVGDTTDTATGTITDDDDAPDVTIGDASATEGGDISFPVTLSNPSSEDVILTFSFTNGTAENGDYTTTDVQITILAGETTGTVVVPTTADTIDEGDETFTVAISSVDSGTVGDTTGTATGTIIDDDNTSQLTLTKTAVASGAQVDDIITYTFTVRNTGNVTINTIMIDDPLTGSVNLSITPSTLAPGEEGSATATYTITQADINLGEVMNSATVIGQDSMGNDVMDISDNGDETVDEDGDGNPTNDPTITVIQQLPNLALSKIGVYTDTNNDRTPNAGDEIRYTFRVQNTGNVDITNIVLTDPLPGIVIEGGPIDLVAGGTDESSFTAVYILTEDDVLSGSVTNQATVTGQGPNGVDVTDVSDDPLNDTDVDTDGDGDFEDETITEIGDIFDLDDDIVVYTGISPNGDGVNDQFRIVGLSSFPNNVLRIYNRWGVLVFEQDGYEQPGANFFAGISSGRVTINKKEELPVGTYYYVLDYENTAGIRKSKAGYLYINK